MAEIFNFSKIGGKTSYRSLIYRIFLKRQNDRKGPYCLPHFFEKLLKSKNWSHRTQKSPNIWIFSDKFTKNNVFWSNDLFFYFFSIFSKMCQSILTLQVISCFMWFCIAQTFWVELHLDVVLEVLKVAGSKFLFY